MKLRTTNPHDAVSLLNLCLTAHDAARSEEDRRAVRRLYNQASTRPGGKRVSVIEFDVAEPILLDLAHRVTGHQPRQWTAEEIAAFTATAFAERPRHGGYREGSGRRKLPPEARKAKISIAIEPETRQRLEALRQGDEPLGVVLDRIVRG